MSDLIEVRIHGQLFRLRAGTEKDHVRELAAYVDDVMDKISRQSGSPSVERTAILAALNVTDTLFQLQRRVDSSNHAVDERITRLVALSDRLLEG
ncbi:cell division protein ZapA [Candidatus Magnetaquicoccus inordinatus]|jgi:cell division protein ZapA|uniref:cell division protein ZapA n=1 Tax=Candidatus Magnetaquicoccus inordinatus TaxID=2496818 RepID=UPI00102B260C|nr:cell division protein ZapA [Candidatus Magnetaquicoccus inordinatus]